MLSSTKNMVDIVSCECLDSKHWRIKYKVSGLIFDDVFKRVTRLDCVDKNES